MDEPSLSQDDILDVAELTDKLEEFIYDTLEQHDGRIAMSALMSASVNCMLTQCNDLEQVMYYRHLFIFVLDNSIRNIKISGPDTST
jgi:hypothetical protein